MSRNSHIRRRWSASAVLVPLALVLATAGCSGSGAEKPEATATSTTSSVSTTSGSGPGAASAFVDVASCENTSGSGTSSGTITNQGSGDTAYEITIGFYDASGKELATASTKTEVAAAGVDVQWSVKASGLGSVSSDDLVCKTVSVKS